MNPESVTWMHTPRGGYGFSYPVDAIVLRRGARRSRILVATRMGVLVERTVKNENLRPTTRCK